MTNESIKQINCLENRDLKKIESLGICLGATTVSCVRLMQDRKVGDPCKLTDNKPQIVDFFVHPHEGDPKQTFLSYLNRLDMGMLNNIAVTGRKYRKFVNLSSIAEAEAVEYAYDFIKPVDKSCPAIVSAGGETFIAYVLDHAGHISNVMTGNKCASGTGEFFFQQLRRMDVSLEEASRWAATETPYLLSGRCSVFCKSDCTHATNKGVPRSAVTSGLCKMMAEKILELLKKVDKKNIIITGGAARNRMMIAYLQKEISGLIVPEEAPFFEALGAALWAMDHKTARFPGTSALLKQNVSSFDILPPLLNFEDRVTFKSVERDTIRSGDECILGLDVGSTTTKAVLIRKEDNAMLASVYLRTNGNPVEASRKCYGSILDQIKKNTDPYDISITGLGVCGSGRKIAGLHALTKSVFNEIIAHATAAVYFDPEVDTIFEIGGQDAKYTHLTNSVPSDYAMNEACSAGTGSFLEESAHETLGVTMEQIADIAMQGLKPPNFNDQCAAFISSDIKNAIHEGLEHDDIIAGLVYSICMNYSNRVKGNRPVGKKIFMQGGVCYNRAVPLAMASLIEKPIVVPPEPGLMGAYGAALEVKRRVENGLIEKKRFDLKTLVERDVKFGKSFICKGGREQCDRKCEIAVMELEGEKYPFGGACNKYYNLRHNISYNTETLNLVRVRENLIFKKYGSTVNRNSGKKIKGRIGFNRSFLVNTYYPLYSAFFSELGFEPVMPDVSSKKGIESRGAAFCFPGELSHGFFHTLLSFDKPPQFIFLPHFKAIPSEDKNLNSQVCPFVQGETFYLRTAFKKQLEELEQRGTKILAPLLDLSRGLEAGGGPFIETAMQMGATRSEALRAFRNAVQKQMECQSEMWKIGDDVLDRLEKTPGKTAAVIFARSYNGFVKEAHMGIPHKFASRGILTIPMDFIRFQHEKAKRHMYWGMGQLIMKAGRFVKRHPRLFGVYITNFSCGPDSFLLGYFRDIMGSKPSLTLELDSHSADAGIETRIEAFLDIIDAYVKLTMKRPAVTIDQPFTPARLVHNNGNLCVITSSGETISMTDSRVKLLFPSMGQLSSESLAAVFRGAGFNAEAHRPADQSVLKLGRANTTCKECLPLILTTGTLLSYIDNGKPKNQIVVYFMPTTSGPCRFGQYTIFIEDLVKKLRIPDVALMSLSSKNSYAGFGNGFQKKALWGAIISDVMEDIRSMIMVCARNVKAAIDLFHKEWERILVELERGIFPLLEKQLVRTAEALRMIPVHKVPGSVPRISLVGEIFVRRDSISRQFLTERLAEKGFATLCAPVSEWILYSDYAVIKGLSAYNPSKAEKLKFFIKMKIIAGYERRIKSILSGSGFVHAEKIDINRIIQNASSYISPNLTGEAILTIGSAITEIASNACGIIAIGPFGCMPNRISEAILNEIMSSKGKLATDPKNKTLMAVLNGVEDLPFLSIESDGSPFPQLTETKLETFCIRAARLHEKMNQARKGK